MFKNIFDSSDNKEKENQSDDKLDYSDKGISDINSNEELFGVEVPKEEFDPNFIKNISGKEIIDGYSLTKNTHVVIYEEPNTGKKLYTVSEPELFIEGVKLLEEIRDPVYEALEQRANKSFECNKEKEEFIRKNANRYIKIVEGAFECVNKMRNLIGLENINPFTNEFVCKLNKKENEIENVIYYLLRDKIGYNKLDPLMNDSHIEDITCAAGANSPIYIYHEKYGYMPTNIAFEKKELDKFIRSLANRSNKTISKSEPILDASLPTGDRLQETYLDEVSNDGSTFTIRRFNDEQLTPIDLLNYESFSSRQMAFLWLATENYKGLIAAGGTGGGKTTTLNASLMFKPPEEKVVSIEDTPEIKLNESNWTSLVTREGLNEDDHIGMEALFKASLRMRPKFIPVGEARDEVIQSAFEAMNSDHTVSATFHASDMDTISSRFSANGVPKEEQFSMDLVTFQEQLSNNKRVANKMVEVVEYDTNKEELITNTLWEYDAYNDSFELKIDSMMNSNIIQEIKKSKGLKDEDIEEELDVRQEILELCMEKDITDSKRVSRIFNRYYNNRVEDNPRETPIYKELQKDNPQILLKGDNNE